MSNFQDTPTQSMVSAVILAMTGENSIVISRITTGDQHFVFDVKTAKSNYVLRMTDPNQKFKFTSALYWQEKLLSLGIPLAKFIQSDLDCRYSPYPSLLMMRLAGNDLCNVYPDLTDLDKSNLAHEIVTIQRMMDTLPNGSCFGFSDSYENSTGYLTWYDFLSDKLKFFKKTIDKNTIFDDVNVKAVFLYAENLANELRLIKSRPFLWDTSERNVIVYEGKISGIVDVDEICFGDPLFVLGLTYVALELEGYDTLYCDYWSDALNLDKNAKNRLAFYRLYYVISFMRKHSSVSNNQIKIVFNIEKLKKMFIEAIERLR